MIMNKKVNYFAYGSNMDKKRMEERGVTAFSMQAARLEGFRLVFNKFLFEEKMKAMLILWKIRKALLKAFFMKSGIRI